MKLHILICFLLVSTRVFPQYKISKDLLFVDSTNTPLEHITNQFHDRVESTIDTSCLQAFGSVKFTVYNKGIKSVFVSVGIPKFIANPLKEAIEASGALWRLNGKRKEINIIIPLFILPSSLCRIENYQDNLLTTMANFVVYEGKPEPVLRRDYLKKAKGAEEALILSPLIIRSGIIDVYKSVPYGR